MPSFESGPSALYTPYMASAPSFPNAAMPFQYSSSGPMTASAPVMGMDDKINSIISTQSDILTMLRGMDSKMRHRDSGPRQESTAALSNSIRNITSKKATKKRPTKKVAPVIPEEVPEEVPEETPEETPAYNANANTPAYNANANTPAYNANANTPAYNANANTPDYSTPANTEAEPNNSENNQFGGRRRTPRQKRKGRATRRA